MTNYQDQKIFDDSIPWSVIRPKRYHTPLSARHEETSEGHVIRVTHKDKLLLTTAPQPSQSKAFEMLHRIVYSSTFFIYDGEA